MTPGLASAIEGTVWALGIGYVCGMAFVVLVLLARRPGRG